MAVARLLLHLAKTSLYKGPCGKGSMVVRSVSVIAPLTSLKNRNRRQLCGLLVSRLKREAI